jgi:DNA polymerase-3 subunit beta
VKITAPASRIAAALSLVAAAARPNQKRPTLGAVRLVAADGAVAFTGTDNDIAITASATAEIAEPGKAAIPNDQFTALIAAFAGDATVTITAMENGVSIVSGRSRYRLPVYPPNDLPAVPTIDKETGRCILSATDCVRLCGTQAAASTGERTRFYLNGIFLQSNKHELVSTACDGAMLIRVSTAADKFSEGRDLVVPSSAVDSVHGLLTKTKSKQITLRRSKRLIEITAPKFVFVSKLIDPGETGYPETERLIPQSNGTAVRCLRADLVASLSRLRAVATNDTQSLVTLCEGDGVLTVRLSRSPDDGDDCIMATGNGLNEVTLPISQLIKMLGEFSDPQVNLEASGLGPLVIRGDGKLALIARANWWTS